MERFLSQACHQENKPAIPRGRLQAFIGNGPPLAEITPWLIGDYKNQLFAVDQPNQNLCFLIRPRAYADNGGS